MVNTDGAYRLAFSYIPGLGATRIAQLEEGFASLEQAWKADECRLKNCGLDERSARSVVEVRPTIDIPACLKKLEDLGIDIIDWHDPAYPPRLKEIYDPPHLLFFKGTLPANDDYCVAVVGSRRSTAYGRQIAEEMATALARYGVNVVSGLARGIDTICHQAALQARGQTLAVLGGGLDRIYPSENTQLAERIAKQGALVSEYPPGVRPRPENFPRRNRIISGLSLGVLVIEAGETSGALITARMALEQNREVMAIPGSVLSAASAGCNKLIQAGAKLILTAEDILQELNLTVNKCQAVLPLVQPDGVVEESILKLLTAEPRHIDEICRDSGVPLKVLSSTLAIMEIKGAVKQVGAMNFALVRERQFGYSVTVE